MLKENSMGDGRGRRSDLVEILRITSANIIQELADYYPPTFPSPTKMSVPLFPQSVKPALAGVSGGLLSTLLLHPLDTLKIRSAAGRGSCSQTVRILTRSGFWDSLRGFYQGISPNCTLSAFSWGLYFLSYESAKARMGLLPGDPANSLIQTAAAMEAGVVTMALTNPLQVLRTRMVLNAQASSMGSLPLAWVIVQREGPSALFRGFTPNLIGVTHGTIQFSLYELMKTNYRTRVPEDYILGAREHICLAAVSKMLASLITFPCQVVRTVLQDAPPIPGAPKPQARDVVKGLISGGKGIKGLYRGLVPHLLHVTPNVCIIFSVYEAVMKL